MRGLRHENPAGRQAGGKSEYRLIQSEGAARGQYNEMIAGVRELQKLFAKSGEFFGGGVESRGTTDGQSGNRRGFYYFGRLEESGRGVIQVYHNYFKLLFHRINRTENSFFRSRTAIRISVYNYFMRKKRKKELREEENMRTEYAAAAFRSPDEAMRALNILRENRIRAELINTPSAARVGCGISVRVEMNEAERMFGLVSGMGTFAGVFRVYNVKGKPVVVSFGK